MIAKFRSLTPEQKARLKERVDALRQLSPVERRRLADNLEKFRALAPERQKALREKLEKMDPEERRKAVELAQGFFRWMNARYEDPKFPRAPFFRWIAVQRPEALQELKQLDPMARKDAFLKLAHEYRVVLIQQLRAHARRHGCITPDQFGDLEAEDFGKFWERAEELGPRGPSHRPPAKRHP
ncbi:MAG TPA: DUF3106 domain-containing protein [Candidatus Eisenbacteria bacterium]|nr:DUF3106 domain-containing protein [Candidatus Eisenbacteria bacterium]